MQKEQNHTPASQTGASGIVECNAQNVGALYRTGDFLRAKHQQTKYDSGREFHKWALDLIPVSQAWRILDAGCGWGRFTWSLVDDYHIPPDRITCSDLSPGMLRTAHEEAVQRKQNVRFCVANIEALPFRSDTFHLAIAAHVLYHLTDIDRGVHELARVTKHRGFLLVTSNSDKIDPLVIDLHYRALRALDIPFLPEEPSPFSMENGREHLARGFARVTTHYFEDSITFPDVATFISLYTTIGRYKMVMENESIDMEKRQRLADEVGKLAAHILETDGILRSPGLMGAFVCENPLIWHRRSLR